MLQAIKTWYHNRMPRERHIANWFERWICRSGLGLCIPEPGDTIWVRLYNQHHLWVGHSQMKAWTVKERFHSAWGSHWVRVWHASSGHVHEGVFELDFSPLFPLLNRMRNEPYRWKLIKHHTEKEWQELERVRKEREFEEAIEDDKIYCSLLDESPTKNANIYVGLDVAKGLDYTTTGRFTSKQSNLEEIRHHHRSREYDVPAAVDAVHFLLQSDQAVMSFPALCEEVERLAQQLRDEGFGVEVS